MPNNLPPPSNYSTWLNYAIATMDTRSLYLEQCWGDEWPDDRAVIERDEMTAAARGELDRLLAAERVVNACLEVDLIQPLPLAIMEPIHRWQEKKL